MIARRAIDPFLSPVCSSLTLSFSLSSSSLDLSRSLIHGDRGRNYYFLTSTSPPPDLSSNDLSIEPRAGNHRTSANGTANGCVLLVPLHLPHYTQFSAGDLIGCLLSFFSSSRFPLLPVRSLLFLFFSCLFVSRKEPLAQSIEGPLSVR